MVDQDQGGLLIFQCKPQSYLGGVEYLLKQGFTSRREGSQIYRDDKDHYHIGFTRKDIVDVEVFFAGPLWNIKDNRLCFNNQHPCIDFLRGLYNTSGGESVLDLEAQVMDPNPFE
jgi:hypothetical protein